MTYSCIASILAAGRSWGVMSLQCVCVSLSVLHIETKHLNIISKKPAPTPGHIHPFPVPPTRSQALPPSPLFLSCPDLSVWFLFGSLCEPIRHRGAAQIELSSRRYTCNPLFQPNPATSALKANGLPFTSMGFDPTSLVTRQPHCPLDTSSQELLLEVHARSQLF